VRQAAQVRFRLLTRPVKRRQTASRLLAALAGVRVLTVLVSSFVLASLAFGVLSGSAKSLGSPVCGFAANGGAGSVVLRGFA
jgi:hypothetical protein